MLEYTNASQCLACHSHEEGTTKDESYNEDALQDILEEENITGQAENLATTEVEAIFWFRGPSWSWCNVLVEGWKKNIILKSMQAKDKAVWTWCVCVCVCGVCGVCVCEREREREKEL